ncbi:hypothetical protein NDI52_32360 [Leptolyngbya sp. PL-A3]
MSKVQAILLEGNDNTICTTFEAAFAKAEKLMESFAFMPDARLGLYS